MLVFKVDLNDITLPLKLLEHLLDRQRFPDETVTQTERALFQLQVIPALAFALKPADESANPHTGLLPNSSQ